jgi:ABC-2 type transport system permease protein
LSVLWPILVRFLTQAVFPPSAATLLFGTPSYEQIQFQQMMSRISPDTLFGESLLGLLHPSTRALGPVFLAQLQGAIVGSPLPLVQSLLLVWPQVTGLIAGTIGLFVATYVVFQRQEVRA